MPDTYTHLYVHIVFAVKGRENCISEIIRERLEKYICGIVANNQSKPLAIYCNPDHVHLMIGLHPSISVSDMVRDIKSNSSKFIKVERLKAGKFSWQEGYAAFTYEKSQIDAVVKYILNQPEHHRKSSF
jgi:REP element-mobilizing transposase RayT